VRRWLTRPRLIALTVALAAITIAVQVEAQIFLRNFRSVKIARPSDVDGTLLTKDKTLISFAASVKTRSIEDAAGLDIAVIRAMPNTPSALGAGAAGLCRGRFVSAQQMELAQRIFETVGRTVIVDEKHMDAVTGLSASGPAYIYIIIEALAEAGVKVGLPRDTATQLAAQTTFGAAKMVLETGYHPALLKDAVTTPAGCTIDGILELEEGGLRVTLIKAVMRATERAKQLAAG